MKQKKRVITIRRVPNNPTLWGVDTSISNDYDLGRLIEREVASAMSYTDQNRFPEIKVVVTRDGEVSALEGRTIQAHARLLAERKRLIAELDANRKEAHRLLHKFDNDKT